MKLPAVALSLAISIPLANAYTGDLTHYTPSLGSCGTVNQNGDAIVALSIALMNNPANPNNNPICNKQISITNPNTGTTTTATVMDTCQACAFGDMDVPDDLFNTIAPNGNGRVPGIEWEPIGWTVPGSSGESESTTAQSSVSSTVQPSSSSALPTISVQEKVAAVASSPAAAAAAPSESSSTSVAPSSIPAVSPSVAPSAASPTNAQTASAPAGSSISCTTAGETICSADGTQIGTCTLQLTVQLGPVAQVVFGAAAVNGDENW